jgi:hypothetical protein
MAGEEVVASLRADGEPAFSAAFGRARDSILGATHAGEESAGGLKGLGKNLVGAAASAAVVKKGFDFMKGAADSAGTLAKSTAALSRSTGLDSSTSSAWVSMTKQRGIELTKLQTSFTAFSKQQVALQGGNKATADAFKQLGVSQADLAATNGDFNKSLALVADGFKELPDGAEKTALATKLFGKQGLALLPILNQGSAALEEQLGVMEKNGLTMDKDGVAKSLELAKAQREMRASMEGVKVSIGQALIPVMVKLSQTVLPVVQKFADILRQSPALTTAVIGLGVAFAGMMVITKVVAIVKAFTGSMALLNAVMAANPIVLVVLAVAALVAGLIIAYQKVGWFRDGVDAAFNGVLSVAKSVFGWIKGNWPLLLGVLTGPFGLAVGLIIKHFDKIKNAAKSVVEAIKGVFSGLPAALGSIISGAGPAIGDALKSAVKSALPGPLAKLLATGGVIAAQTGLTAGSGKNVLVGERGPEMLTLPSGSRVTPLPPPSLAGAQLGSGGDQPIVAQVFLERRMIAEAMASYTAERQASR